MPSDPDNSPTLRDWLEVGLFFAAVLIMLVSVPLMGG